MYAPVTDHYRRVSDLMTAGGQNTPARPTISSCDVRKLRARIILEEALEFCEAAGLDVFLDTQQGSARIVAEELQFRRNGGGCSLQEMAKELADISVVTIGSLVAFGIRDVQLLEEVDANNLYKLHPQAKSTRREDGKIIKDPNHPKADVGRVLRLQGYRE